MTLSTSDPQMSQMIEQMGFGPMETTVSGGAKQVIMRLKMPAADLPGQVDEWEYRSISQNGRTAFLISSPAAPRIVKRNDAVLAKTMAQQNAMLARTIAQSAAQGPIGWARAAMLAAEAPALDAALLSAKKKADDFFSWKCMAAPKQEAVDRSALPLTDLTVVGDQNLDGVAVTAYEFYVRDKDQFHGPMRMYVAKDSGLPARMEMTDARMRGAKMQMDYYDFNKAGEIEIPACLAQGK
jgi:hypothetical protein